MGQRICHALNKRVEHRQVHIRAVRDPARRTSTQQVGQREAYITCKNTRSLGILTDTVIPKDTAIPNDTGYSDTQ
jgi:hypothetical protein